MDEATEIRRKRLRFRSWHRGTREADLLLGPFADRHLPEFPAALLDRYEVLLQENDADLVDWITGRTPPPEAHAGEVMRLLQSFRFQPRAG